METIFIHVIEKPKRKAIAKRGVNASHYFEYCEEVGCDVWDLLLNIQDATNEPVGMWLPENMILPHTSSYIQGVEVPFSYEGDVPEGFEVLELPACHMMVFQGSPFEKTHFETAIETVWKAIAEYDPTLQGFKWAPELAPRMQLEPICNRGYIEMLPVVKL